MCDSVRTEGKADHGLGGLDIVLTKLDTSTTGWQPNSLSEATTGQSLQKLPQESAPPYMRSYPSSTTSTRSLLRDYTPGDRCVNTRCGCRLAVLTIVLLLVIWGIAVPLYFFVGPGRADIQRAAEVHLMEQLSDIHQTASGQTGVSRTAHHTNGTIFSAVNCSIRIANQLFSAKLEDLETTHYHTLALQLETLMTIVFQKDPSFHRAVVRRFRLGTVVELTLIFSEERSDIQEYVVATLTDYLMTNWLMLGRFQMDLTTLTVSYLRDPCLVHNGGCSHLCFWSILRIQHLCECPEQYYLSDDNRTCQQIVPARLDQVMHNHKCQTGQFQCAHHDNCIPESWVCDGVSDCIHEEDEEPWICESALQQVKRNSALSTKDMAPLHGRGSLGGLPVPIQSHDLWSEGEADNSHLQRDSQEHRNTLRINIDESSAGDLDDNTRYGALHEESNEVSIINHENDIITDS